MVGGGLAGLSAAHTVLEHGGRVLLLDKSAFCGGNSSAPPAPAPPSTPWPPPVSPRPSSPASAAGASPSPPGDARGDTWRPPRARPRPGPARAARGVAPGGARERARGSSPVKPGPGAGDRGSGGAAGASGPAPNPSARSGALPPSPAGTGVTFPHPLRDLDELLDEPPERPAPGPARPGPPRPAPARRSGWGLARPGGNHGSCGRAAGGAARLPSLFPSLPDRSVGRRRTQRTPPPGR